VLVLAASVGPAGSPRGLTPTPEPAHQGDTLGLQRFSDVTKFNVVRIE